MKTLIKKFGLPIAIGLSMIISSVIGITTSTFSSCGKAHKCLDKDMPLSCENTQGCCPTDKPFSDGEHCWASMSDCQLVGAGACEQCFKE